VTISGKPSAVGGTRPRLDPDTRGGLRLTLTAAGLLVLAVPFALLLLLVVDHWGPLQRLDHDLAARLNAFAFPHPGYVTFLKVISTVGHPAAFEAVTVAVAAWLLVRRRPRLAAWLAVTVFGGGLLSTIVKNAVGRRRPLLPHPVAHAASASFPSGHALGSVVGVGALLLVFLPSARPTVRPAWIGLGMLVVLAIGFSRLGLGVHYLSDVLGGYLLGAGWLAVITAAFTAWRRDLAQPERPASAGLEPAAPEPHP
jgi:membrane-associated phospholipid phosphatase